MFKRKFILVFYWLLPVHVMMGQDAQSLVQLVKSKLAMVSSYEAAGTLVTRVSYLKVPPSSVTVYYKRPDKFAVRNEKGISLVPKSMLRFSLTGVLEGKSAVIDMGNELLDGATVRVVKLLPASEDQDIVLSTLYIDPASALVRKARCTTKEYGTYEVSLSYGRWKSVGLPDKIVCSFNTKDYQLPKGLTFDYDDGSKQKEGSAASGQKAEVEIDYHSYQVNKKFPDSVFL
jgi:outer membrane lipoprotein-sorting protein